MRSHRAPAFRWGPFGLPERQAIWKCRMSKKRFEVVAIRTSCAVLWVDAATKEDAEAQALEVGFGPGETVDLEVVEINELTPEIEAASEGSYDARQPWPAASL